MYTFLYASLDAPKEYFGLLLSKSDGMSYWLHGGEPIGEEKWLTEYKIWLTTSMA